MILNTRVKNSSVGDSSPTQHTTAVQVAGDNIIELGEQSSYRALIHAVCTAVMCFAAAEVLSYENFDTETLVS